jgi:hypothetical protein
VRLARQLIAHGVVALLLAFSLWWLIRWESGGGGGWPLYLAVAWSALCGIALSHIVHEWGHFLGGLVSGSALVVKPAVHPLFFDFDYQANTPGQFLALGAGGLLGNVSLLLVLLLSVPPVTLVATGLLAAVVGQLVFVLVLELPVSLGVRAGGDPLQTLGAHFSQGAPLFLRAAVAGLVTAALVLLLLPLP